MLLSSSKDKYTLLQSQMFLLVSSRHFSAHPNGHQYTNLHKFGIKLLLVSRIRKIAVT